MSELDVWLAQGGELKRNSKGVEYIEINGEIVAKRCTKCGEIKELGGYSKDKHSVGGRKAKCKLCVAEYYQENRERRLENVRKWRQENLEYARKYYQENRDRNLEYNHKWRQENRDHRLEYARKYIRENREKYRLINQRRRARKAGLPDDLTTEQKSQIIKRFDGGCALSGTTDDVHLDHVIPIAVGHGGTTYGNMIPLRADINISKSDSNIFEWFKRNRQRFELSQERFNSLIEYLATANAMTVEEYRKHVYWCHANPRDLADETDEEAI